MVMHLLKEIAGQCIQISREVLKGLMTQTYVINYNKCMELMNGLALILMKPNLIDTRNLQFFLLVRESHQMSEAISVARFGYR